MEREGKEKKERKVAGSKMSECYISIYPDPTEIHI